MSQCLDRSSGRVLQDAEFSNVKVNNVIAAQKITSCKDESDKVEALAVIAGSVVTNTLFVDGVPVSGGGGAVGPPGPDGPDGAPGPQGASLVAWPTDAGLVFNGTQGVIGGGGNLFDNGDPLGTVNTITFDLGVTGVRAAWVAPKCSTFDTNARSINTLTNTFSQVGSHETDSLVYVTQDPLETKRYTGHSYERFTTDDITITPVGYATVSPVRQTASDLGYVFGSKDRLGNEVSLVFNTTSASTATFNVTAVFLDDAGPTTQLVMECTLFNTMTTNTNLSTGDLIGVYLL